MGPEDIVRESYSALLPFGAGVALRAEGRVRGLFGLAFQGAYNPDGSAGSVFLAGATGVIALEIPMGSGPLALRIAGEPGFLASWPTLRIGAQFVIGG